MLRKISKNENKVYTKEYPKWFEDMMTNDYGKDVYDKIVNYRHEGINFRLLDTDVIKDIHEEQLCYNICIFAANSIQIKNISNLTEF